MTGQWTRYYEHAGPEPRATLLLALDRFESEQPPQASRFAVDLGCGTGRDTAELLRRGWQVLAIDTQEEAIERLQASIGEQRLLSTKVAPIDDADWPQALLVNASFSLPFCGADRFAAVWEHIRGSLATGGRFCGQLFGDRDGWATGGASPAKGEITFHTRDEVETLVAPYDVERLDEIEEDGQTAVGDPKHWHVFHLVLRKP